MYGLWAMNDYHYYFDKVANSENDMLKVKKSRKISSDNDIQVVDADEFNKK